MITTATITSVVVILSVVAAVCIIGSYYAVHKRMQALKTEIELLKAKR